ncbi:Uncharacterized protein Rs2_05146 [Raphanus sativus]|nr:Uncharacterized protein Rs2_05146 [Raphanus sativus]
MPEGYYKDSAAELKEERASLLEDWLNMETNFGILPKYLQDLHEKHESWILPFEGGNHGILSVSGPSLQMDNTLHPDIKDCVFYLEGNHMHSSIHKITSLLWFQTVNQILTAADILKHTGINTVCDVGAMVNPKLFGVNLYLNSTLGTRFFFDTNLPEITEFVSS